MNQEEHLSMARELIRRANQEPQGGGSEMIAAEFLWGAFAHCLIAVAQNERLPHDSHRAFSRIAQHMDAAQGGNRWRSYFGSAEQLHEHFYHGDLPTRELHTHTQLTALSALELLSTL